MAAEFLFCLGIIFLWLVKVSHNLLFQMQEGNSTPWCDVRNAKNLIII